VKRLLAILAVFLGACGASPTVSQEEQSLAPPSPTPAASLATPMPSRLATIIIDADAAPEGTSLDEARDTSEAAVVRVVISGSDAEFLALPGLSAGRYRQFSGDGGLFLSLGVEFETVANADRAFDLFLNELESEEGYGLDSRTSETIGDEGKCTEGPNPDLGGLQERICLWRTGQVILVAGGTLEWAALYALAHGMDSRAR
jgi:hypothetical protein